MEKKRTSPIEEEKISDDTLPFGEFDEFTTEIDEPEYSEGKTYWLTEPSVHQYDDESRTVKFGVLDNGRLKGYLVAELEILNANLSKEEAMKDIDIDSPSFKYEDIYVLTFGMEAEILTVVLNEHMDYINQHLVEVAQSIHREYYKLTPKEMLSIYRFYEPDDGYDGEYIEQD